jgi:hypothetical protein
MFDVVLALDCLPDFVETFKIDEALQSMALCKAINEPRPMFEHSTDKIIGHANVQGAVESIGQNVNIATGHREIVKDVDGRDKPGHDEGTTKS